jgi:uncharacterized membrane protein YeaQ/YmgE (transglycosylase-associated protein family)
MAPFAAYVCVYRIGQTERRQMSIIAWLFVGLTAGFLASKLVGKTGARLTTDITLGVIGAIVGGFLFTFFGYMAPEGIDLYNVTSSAVGAVAVLLVYHAVVRRRAI